MATIQEAFDALREKGAKGVEGALNTPVQISPRDAAARVGQIERAGDTIASSLEDALKAFGVLELLDQQIDLGAPIIEEAEAEAGVETAVDTDDRFFIDPHTANIFRGLPMGRFRTGQEIVAIRLLADRDTPASIHDLTSAILGEDTRQLQAQVRSKVAEWNEIAKGQGLPRPILHTRGGGGEGYALNRTYTLLTELLDSSGGNKPKEFTLEDIATAWGRSTNRTRIIIDRLVEEGGLLEGEDVRDGPYGGRTIRRYTAKGFGKLMGLAPVLANSGRVEVSDLLAALRQDQAEISESVADKPASEKKYPFGPNGPETVDNAVELLMINALLHVAPAAERTIKQPLLSPEDALALKTRARELSDFLYIEPDQRVQKRRLAAAAAYEIGEAGLSRGGFNFMMEDHPSLLLVERALNLVKQKDPEYAARFPYAIVDPPKPVTKQGRNGEVEGREILLVGAMGDREQ